MLARNGESGARSFVASPASSRGGRRFSPRSEIGNLGRIISIRPVPITASYKVFLVFSFYHNRLALEFPDVPEKALRAITFAIDGMKLHDRSPISPLPGASLIGQPAYAPRTSPSELKLTGLIVRSGCRTVTGATALESRRSDAAHRSELRLGS